MTSRMAALCAGNIWVLASLCFSSLCSHLSLVSLSTGARHPAAPRALYNACISMHPLTPYGCMCGQYALAVSSCAQSGGEAAGHVPSGIKSARPRTRLYRFYLPCLIWWVAAVERMHVMQITMQVLRSREICKGGTEWWWGWLCDGCWGLGCTSALSSRSSLLEVKIRVV